MAEDRVRVADLPSIHNLDANSYMIVEKPGYNEGTFKTTVGDLQRAISVAASVTQVGTITTIHIHDINGDTEANITTPTASVVNNGDNTITITITDANGTTQETIVDARNFDPQPTQGSNNLLTSGTVYTAIQALTQTIQSLSQSLSQLSGKVEQLETAMGGITLRLVQ